MDENMALTPYETREILFYKTDNGDVKVEILLYQENLWLTQAKMAELFEVPVSVLLGGGPEVEEEQPSELNEIAQQLAVTGCNSIGNNSLACQIIWHKPPDKMKITGNNIVL